MVINRNEINFIEVLANKIEVKLHSDRGIMKQLELPKKII